MYVDSDDWIEIDMVEKLHKISIDYKLDIVVCNMTTENRGYVNEFTSVEILSNEKLKKEFIKHKSVNGSFCNKLINKALLTGLHFNEEIGYGEDAALMWEIIKKDPIMGITEYSFYHYQNNPNSISRKSFSSTKYDAVRVWKKILNDVEKFYSLLLYYARVAYIDANLITLWEMARANYIDKENEVKFLNNLKKYYKEYCRAEWISKQRKVFASTCIINYRMAGKILRCIKR